MVLLMLALQLLMSQYLRMAYEYYPPVEGSFLEQDIRNIQWMVDELKVRAQENPGLDPEGYAGVVIQQLRAPSISIAAHEALAHLGYDCATVYRTGGQGEKTALWAAASANEGHVGKIRSLAVKSYANTLYRMLSKASHGELVDFSLRDEGFSSRDYPTQGLYGEILPRAFLTSEIVRCIREYGVIERHRSWYEIMRSNGWHPLGFEEMGGLAMTAMEEVIDLNPDLAPE